MSAEMKVTGTPFLGAVRTLAVAVAQHAPHAAGRAGVVARSEAGATAFTAEDARMLAAGLVAAADEVDRINGALR